VSSLLRRELVDPRGGRQLWWDGRLADEPLGIALVGGVEHAGAGGVQLRCLAVVDGGWVISPIPEWRCWWLYQSKNTRQ
jgi:hypothetical protein